MSEEEIQEHIFTPTVPGRLASACTFNDLAHPMYTGTGCAALAIPLALGSYVAEPLFALLVPLLIYRLVHEEKTLRRHLRGYPEYRNHTSFRSLPWVWQSEKTITIRFPRQCRIRRGDVRFSQDHSLGRLAVRRSRSAYRRLERISEARNDQIVLQAGRLVLPSGSRSS